MLGTGCGCGLVGERTLERHRQALAKFGHLVEEMELTPQKFRYGNGSTDEAIGKVKVLCFIQGKEVFIVFFVVPGDVPMLVSKRCLKAMGANMNLVTNEIEFPKIGAKVKMVEPGWLVSAGPHGRHHVQGDRPARG